MAEIALREGLTLTGYADDYGYAVVLAGVDDDGRPFRVRLFKGVLDLVINEGLARRLEASRLEEPS